MRGGNRTAALGLLIASLLPLQFASASTFSDIDPSTGGGGGTGSALTKVSNKLRDLLPFLHQIQTNPTQAIVPAGTQGTVVDPSHLEEPVRLERSLRNAMSDKSDAVHLTVTNGTAHMGTTAVKAGEVVHGHLVVLKGDADITGRVEGNVVALDGNIILRKGASIVGDALSIGGKVQSEGGVIGGAATESAAGVQAIEAPINIPAQVARRGAGLVGMVLTMLVLGFATVTFVRPNLEIVSDTISHSVSRSFFAGLLGEMLVLPSLGLLIIGLVITILGTVLVPFALAVFTFLIVVALIGGIIAVAFNMGETITRRRMANGARISPNAYRYLLTGIGGLSAIWLTWIAFGWVPIAGTLMLVVAVLSTWLLGTIGFGAALLSRGGVRENFAGRLIPPVMMTDEHLWATPRMGVPVVRRPPPVEKE